MHPKFILVSEPQSPLTGTFVYGMVFQHKDLVKGYVKVHGGGWYSKDDAAKTMTLSPIWGLPGNELELTDVEWF